MIVRLLVVYSLDLLLASLYDFVYLLFGCLDLDDWVCVLVLLCLVVIGVLG